MTSSFLYLWWAYSPAFHLNGPKQWTCSIVLYENKAAVERSAEIKNHPPCGGWSRLMCVAYGIGSLWDDDVDGTALNAIRVNLIRRRRRAR